MSQKGCHYKESYGWMQYPTPSPNCLPVSRKYGDHVNMGTPYFRDHNIISFYYGDPPPIEFRHPVEANCSYNLNINFPNTCT
jgi:hypothetical protein